MWKLLGALINISLPLMIAKVTGTTCHEMNGEEFLLFVVGDGV